MGSHNIKFSSRSYFQAWALAYPFLNLHFAKGSCSVHECLSQQWQPSHRVVTAEAGDKCAMFTVGVLHTFCIPPSYIFPNLHTPISLFEYPCAIICIPWNFLRTPLNLLHTPWNFYRTPWNFLNAPWAQVPQVEKPWFTGYRRNPICLTQYTRPLCTGPLKKQFDISIFCSSLVQRNWEHRSNFTPYNFSVPARSDGFEIKGVMNKIWGGYKTKLMTVRWLASKCSQTVELVTYVYLCWWPSYQLCTPPDFRIWTVWAG